MLSKQGVFGQEIKPINTSKKFMEMYMEAIKDKNMAYLRTHGGISVFDMNGSRYRATEQISLGLLDNKDTSYVDNFIVRDSDKDNEFLVTAKMMVSEVPALHTIHVKVTATGANWQVSGYSTTHMEYITPYKDFEVKDSIFLSPEGKYTFQGYNTPTTATIKFSKFYDSYTEVFYYELDGETEISLAGHTIHLEKGDNNMLKVKGSNQ